MTISSRTRLYTLILGCLWSGAAGAADTDGGGVSDANEGAAASDDSDAERRGQQRLGAEPRAGAGGRWGGRGLGKV